MIQIAMPFSTCVKGVLIRGKHLWLTAPPSSVLEPSVSKRQPKFHCLLLFVGLFLSFPRALQSGFGVTSSVGLGEFFGKFPAEFSANSSAKFSSELFGLVSPGCQAPPPQKKIARPKFTPKLLQFHFSETNFCSCGFSAYGADQSLSCSTYCASGLSVLVGLRALFNSLFLGVLFLFCSVSRCLDFLWKSLLGFVDGLNGSTSMQRLILKQSWAILHKGSWGPSWAITRDYGSCTMPLVVEPMGLGPVQSVLDKLLFGAQGHNFIPCPP